MNRFSWIKNFLILILFTFLLFSTVQAGRVNYNATLVMSSIVGFGMANFMVADIKRGLGYFFLDIFNTGMISLLVFKEFILEEAKLNENIGEVSSLNANKKSTRNDVDITLITLGSLGLVSLVISRVMQVYQANKYYMREVQFSYDPYMYRIKTMYRESLSSMKPFDIQMGMMSVYFKGLL